MHYLRRLPILRRFVTSVATRTPISSATTPNGTPSISSTISFETEMEWIESEEPLEDYDETGYLPMSIGDVLGSRYHVEQKLGWGVYSTVWLVKNESTVPQSYGALKVLKGVASDSDKLHELEFLELLRDQSPSHPGYPYVIKLLDHFFHQGINYRHLCLVTEPLVETLDSYYRRWKSKRMARTLLRRIAQQVVLALDYLHNECNIIHADIKLSNIMLALPQHIPSFADITSYDDCIDTMAGTSPYGRSITRTRSCRLSYPLPSGNVNDPDSWKDVEIRLADVGASCYADKVSEHYTDLIQSSAMRAPEVVIGAGWGKPADIWSLGCAMFELAYGKTLLQPDCMDESVFYIHNILFGDYPEEMIERGKYRNVYIDDDGSFKLKDLMPPRQSFKWKVYGTDGAVSHDNEILFDFLQAMLMLDPTKRATCRDLLAHEYLRDERSLHGHSSASSSAGLHKSLKG